MPHAVDFNTVSTVGLESSPVAAPLAGLRAHEARYFKNKYDHVFAVEPASNEIGTLLPCNVVVYQQHGQTHIAAVDAEQMLSIVGNDDLAPTASEVRRRLSAVVDRAARTPSVSPA